MDKIVEIIYDNKIEYIINFAAQGMVAQSWDAPVQWFETNTLSLVALLDKIHKFDFIKKFVQASTPEVYGSCNNQVESHLYQPSTPYAASKASADMILYSYHKSQNFPINYTRAANVYGPYQQLYRIIPKTILSIKRGSKIPLHGGGKSVRSFIHIDDVSNATLKIAQEAKSGEIYHLSSDKSISIYDLVDTIAKSLDIAIEDVIEVTDDRVGKDSVYMMNSQKIYDELGFRTQISLQDGIKSVVEWVDEYYEALIKHPDYYIHKK
jgi:dTDP-glucose 4,6-dehydratase